MTRGGCVFPTPPSSDTAWALLLLVLRERLPALALAHSPPACEFPGGRRVIGNEILELRDGLVVREHGVQIGDSS
jgi:hypothetical protein